ncbi:hypothetical protein C8A01DRAFT_20316 [Parachaetomium inaequale]|uniref:Uncharacterized protein n=1 Tax=Parachaetomium inaequale TaxID=2588326 RepID=A0AAN6P882_9PEZI|nr:hypothetical protein C8A01DRAFT_20316 [Parachaetomium inaequale]
MSRVHFRVFMSQAKAPLVDPHSFFFPFDSETMECVKDIPVFKQGRAVPIVDLPVSPGVFKAGNSDGANYDSERVLVKFQALFNLQSTLAFLDGGRVTGKECGDGRSNAKEQRH